MYALIKIENGSVVEYIIARNFHLLMLQLKETQNPDAIGFIDARNEKPEIHPDMSQGIHVLSNGFTLLKSFG